MSGRFLKVGSLSVMGLLIAGLAFGSAYLWQHTQTTTLSTKIDSLNVTINSLNDQVALLSNELSKACPANQPGVVPATACQNFIYYSEKGVKIYVYKPVKNATVSSPLLVVGEVPGNWSFEAAFPVRLLNFQGEVVVQSPAKLLGNWTTTNLVPFYVQLDYTTAQTGSGQLVLVKDNPLGLNQNDDQLTIPIKF